MKVTRFERDAHRAVSLSDQGEGVMTSHDSDSFPQRESEPMSEAPEDTHRIEEIPSRSVDPTRYGDWEKNGRCLDF